MLVVDDAVVVRRLLTQALDAERDLEVVAAAPNGRVALQRIARERPDVVILDVDMPELDGVSTMREIHKLAPKLPVIMFSHATERGAKVTLDALGAGARDYVLKPTGGPGPTRAAIRNELVPRIRVLTGRGTPAGGATNIARSSRRRPAPGPESVEAARRAARDAGTVIEAVVIGVSTGGPLALAELMPALPKHFPVPILVVQHMPPTFTRLLAERLDGGSPLRIAEAVGGERPRAGEVWLAPGGRHLGVTADRTGPMLRVHDAPPEHSSRPSVDVLFREAADVWGAGVLAVVLTGMGADGALGARSVVEHGGQVYVQDRESCAVWGMPRAAVEAGVADRVLPLGEMAAALTERVRQRSPVEPLDPAPRSRHWFARGA